MSGSASERLIRDYAAQRLRAMFPDARIIHELVVDGARADLAAVQPERITLVEIKSEKDTLDRLAGQMKHFCRAAHDVIVIVHERWFDRTPYLTGAPRFVPSDALQQGCGHTPVIWAFPEEPDRAMYGTWSLRRQWSAQPEPHAMRLLNLLWKQELLNEAARHRIAASSRSTMQTLVRDMAWHMTGCEIARAVCRQLRQRPFPEADAAIVSDVVAA